MMIVNKYRIKSGATHSDIKNALNLHHFPISTHVSYISKDAIYGTHKTIASRISVNVGFPEDLSKWDSFDHVLVLDEDFGQPYTPFYSGKYTSAFLERVITNYNAFMDSLSFLERVDDDESDVS